jgi:hypothetical protein
MGKRRMVEVLEWETASVALMEESQRAVQPRDGRSKQHQKQDKEQCVRRACHSSRMNMRISSCGCWIFA